jgi:hypothetical protein
MAQSDRLSQSSGRDVLVFGAQNYTYVSISILTGNRPNGHLI